MFQTTTAPARIGRLIPSLVAVALLLAACGGSGGSLDAAGAGTETVVAAATTESAPTAVVAPEDDPAEPAAAPEPTATLEPTIESEATPEPPPTSQPAATPAPVVPAFEIAELIELVPLADRAVTDPSVDPLDLAQRIVGFGYPIPSPAGSTLFALDADLYGVVEGVRDYSFSYETVAGSPVADVDITLDGNGPGSAHIIDVYDPIMADLGFRRTASTGSDPGDPGGPNSVNHVYEPADRAQTINAVPGELPNIKIWLSEDIVGGAYSDDVDIAGGYSFDYDFESSADAPYVAPVFTAFEALMALPGGAILDRADIGLRSRRADSFRADQGLNYLAVSMTWLLPGADHDAVLAFYADPDSFADETILIAAERDFFDETAMLRTTIGEYGDDRHDLTVMLLQRWEGVITVKFDPAEDDFVRIELRLDLNPMVGPLELPQE